jgi:prepilin-type N-terminal cleavage/methylation domain-containing protein
MKTRAYVNARPAFTLVEILVVVVILGIAAAIILPQMSNRDDLRASSMARTLMADLAYAQARAVSTQKSQYVRFDVTNNRYDVLDQFTPSEQVITHPVDKTPFLVQLGAARQDSLKDVVLDTVSFDTRTVIMFDELGTPHSYDPSTNVSSPLVTGSVQLRCNAYTLSVNVQPYSGELTVN